MKTFNSSEILDRLKTALCLGNDTELAQTLGIKKATLSNWRSRNSLDWPLLFSFCEHKNLKWVIYGHEENADDSENLSYDSEQRQLQETFQTTKSNAYGAIPLVSEKAVGGFSNEHFSIKEQDILDYYIVPRFKRQNVDFLIEVIGDSMIPRLCPGDIIACSIIHSSRFIQWNKCHLIATREQGMIVKRIMPGKTNDTLQAVSDNKDYPPFDIPKDEIEGIARIVGVIHFE